MTGGTASGKSALGALLRRRGAAVYSVDEAAHDLYRPGRPAHRRIVRVFGMRVLARDGAVSRQALGARVFSDSAAMRRLEGIVHPLLRRESAAAVRRMRKRHALTVVEAGPLLFELKLDRLADMVVVTRCRAAVRRDRLRRRGLAAREAAMRVGAAAALEDSLPRRARETGRELLVDNDGDPVRLEKAADVIVARAKECASALT